MADRVTWRGKQVADDVRDASRKGIDMTLAQCIAPAKALTPVVTGTAQGSIMSQLAKIFRNRVTGRWGSFDVNYFIWLEIGARGRSGINMLRRTADRIYPNLAGNIRRFL